jgi:hypothetical protein
MGIGVMAQRRGAHLIRVAWFVRAHRAITPEAAGIARCQLSAGQPEHAHPRQLSQSPLCLKLIHDHLVDDLEQITLPDRSRV